MAAGDNKDNKREDARAARLKKALRANLARRKASNTGSGEAVAMKRREAALRKAAGTASGKISSDD